MMDPLVNMQFELSIMNFILYNTPSHNVEFANSPALSTALSAAYCVYEFDFKQELKPQHAQVCCPEANGSYSFYITFPLSAASIASWRTMVVTY